MRALVFDPVKNQPEIIKEVVLKVFEKLSEGQPQEQFDGQRLVEDVFSDQERKHLKFLGRKERTLFFCVDSPAWLFQLNLKRAKILQAVQKSIPDIQKVYFKIGQIT